MLGIFAETIDPSQHSHNNIISMQADSQKNVLQCFKFQHGLDGYLSVEFPRYFTVVLYCQVDCNEGHFINLCNFYCEFYINY